MLLEEILERNKRYVEGREPRPLVDPKPLRLAVLACYDPRLDDLLKPALGLHTEEAVLLRTAGATVLPGGDPLRSLCLAVFVFGVTDVLVVGHTSCRMAAFDTASFIEGFRGRGVARAAFGAGDLRSWASALPNPRRGIQDSVTMIRSAPFLPADLGVAGLLLDDTTGSLEVVVKPGEEVPISAAAAIAAAELVTSASSIYVSAVGAVPEGAGGAEAMGDPMATSTVGGADLPPDPSHDAHLPHDAQPSDLLTVVSALQAFVNTLESKAHYRDEVRNLRQELERHRNPLARYRLLESFIKKAAGDSREIAVAFEELKREAFREHRRSFSGGILNAFRKAMEEKRT